MNTQINFPSMNFNKIALVISLVVGGIAVNSVFASANALTATKPSIITNSSLDYWNFDFTLANGEEAKGTFETSSTPSLPSPPFPSTGYLILDIEGNLDTSNGLEAMSLLPVNSNGGVNNNILYPTTDPNLDYQGFSFSTQSESYNIYNDNSAGPLTYQQQPLSTGDSQNLPTGDSPNLQNWTAVTLVVPEPLTILGSLTALGFGITLKRKKDKSS